MAPHCFGEGTILTQIHGEVLREMLRSKVARNQDGEEISVNSSISAQSVGRIQQLIAELKPRHCLEIGCAMAASTLAVLYALQKIGSGTHVAIDPNQTGSGDSQWGGTGVEMVRAAGLTDLFTLLEEPSYTALPRLVSQNARFDFIFIDGWHSFDYTFVDYFYSDLLLRDRGVLVFDDWEMPQVHHVCWFLETHKAYERITPSPLWHPLNPLRRLKSRFTQNGANSNWGSIRAYRKIHNTTVPWSFFECEFYPYFRLYRYWLKIRELKMNSP